MTDKELAGKADKAFRATTVSYPTWLKNVKAGKYPASGPPSQFGIGFEALSQIGASPAEPPFGTRPTMQAQAFAGAHDVVISNKTVQGLVNGRSLTLENCVNVTIRDVDLLAGGGIYLLNCSGILDISGLRAGKVGWNVIQLDKCVMQGPAGVAAIRAVKALGGTKTEDMISIYSSGGPDSAHPLVLDDIHLQGGIYTSASGSGLMTESASHVVARNFTMLDPGQVGFGLHGTDLHFTDFSVYSNPLPLSNVGIDAGDLSASGLEIARGKVKWFNASGGQNPIWLNGRTDIAGLSTNDFHAPLNPASLAVVL